MSNTFLDSEDASVGEKKSFPSWNSYSSDKKQKLPDDDKFKEEK